MDKDKDKEKDLNVKKDLTKKSSFFKQKTKIKEKKEVKPIPAKHHVASEVTFNIDEVNEKFEKLLDDMNIPSDKRDGLRERTMDVKVQMISNSKSSHTKQVVEYIDLLRQIIGDKLPEKQIIENLDAVRICLNSNPVSWIKEFNNPTNDGLNLLIAVLNTLNDLPESSVVCLKCFRAFANCGYGLLRLLENENAFLFIAKSLKPSNPHLMYVAVEILSILAFYNGNSYQSVMDALFKAAKFNNYENRFTPLIEGAKLIAPENEQESLSLACSRFINVIVSPKFLDTNNANIDEYYRLHLRREFVNYQLLQVYDDLLRNDKLTLTHEQINRFLQEYESEEEDINDKSETIIRAFHDQHDLFRILNRSLSNTGCETHLRSILSSLLIIRDDPLRDDIFRFIDQVVSEIILQDENGYCPDPTLRKFDKISLKKYFEDEGLEDVRKELDNERLKKEEALLMLEMYKAKGKFDEKPTNENFNKAKEQIANAEAKKHDGQESTHKTSSVVPAPPPPPGPPPPPIGGPAPPPPPGPPPPPIGGPAPPPPPGPPPPPIGGPAPPPPPGPPPPGIGGPPPPPGPPPPGIGGPPPPPPPPGSGIPAPPPPPGGVPCPPSMNAQKPPDIFQKLGLSRNVYQPQQQMKKANWNKINEKNINEKSVWLSIKEETIPMDILKELEENFASKPPPEKVDASKVAAATKKVKELKVLDGKTAQNISILLGSLRMDYQKLKDAILELDTSILTQSMMEQLIKNLPEPEQMQKVTELGDIYNDLSESEQFCYQLSSIKKLKPRLESTLFQLRFDDKINEIKGQYHEAEMAITEITKSPGLKKILEIVLSLGNYMNSGSRNQQSIGFELNFLCKLSSTKDKTNNRTLIHFLAEIIMKTSFHPNELVKELSHIEKANRLSLDVTNSNLAEIKKELKALENLVKSFKPSNENDKFFEKMAPFVTLVQEQIVVAEMFQSKMNEAFGFVTEYFTFNSSSYKMEDLFSDIAKFKTEFLDAHKANEDKKLVEERALKAKMEKERREQEKQVQVAHPTTSEEDSGVLDNLLAVLKSGDGALAPKRRKPKAKENRRVVNRSRSRVEFNENMTNNLIEIAS